MHKLTDKFQVLIFQREKYQTSPFFALNRFNSIFINKVLMRALSDLSKDIYKQTF